MAIPMQVNVTRMKVVVAPYGEQLVTIVGAVDAQVPVAVDISVAFGRDDQTGTIEFRPTEHIALGVRTDLYMLRGMVGDKVADVCLSYLRLEMALGTVTIRS